MNEDQLRAIAMRPPMTATTWEVLERTASLGVDASVIALSVGERDRLVEAARAATEPMAWRARQVEVLTAERDSLRTALETLVDACEMWAGDDMPDGQILLPRRVARAIGPARAALAGSGESRAASVGETQP